MLQQIFHIIFISTCCIIWGVPALLYVHKNKQESFLKQLMPGTLLFMFFSGLMTLSIFCALICIFFPLNFQSLLISTSCLFFYLLIFQRKNINETGRNISFKSHLSIFEFFFICISLLVFILLGTLKTVNSDTHIYHTQIILWFNEYGAVPGIANLFPRFGLGSNWLNLTSLFRLPFFGHENFSYLNSTLVIWVFLWLFFKWKQHSKNYSANAASKTMSLFYLLILLFCLYEWELFRDAANSANYDFIVTALHIIIVSFLIENILFNNDKKHFSILFVVLCLSIIPIKLSGIFILLPLSFYFLYSFSKKNLFLTFCAALVILIPLFIRNYIISGYPLFPLSFGFSSPDWQLPAAMADHIKQYILVTNRFYNSELDFTKIPEQLNKPWVWSWFNGIRLQHKILFAASFSSLALFFAKTKHELDFKKLRILFFLFLLMEAGWFLTAPSPRFGYGILLIVALFPICLFAAGKIPLMAPKFLLVLTMVFSCYYLYKKWTPFFENKNLLIYPDVFDLPPVKIINIKGTSFYFPEKNNTDYIRSCYHTTLPCICQENKYLEPRGKSLKDGFRMNSKPDSIFIKNYTY